MACIDVNWLLNRKNKGRSSLNYCENTANPMNPGETSWRNSGEKARNYCKATFANLMSKLSCISKGLLISYQAFA